MYIINLQASTKTIQNKSTNEITWKYKIVNLKESSTKGKQNIEQNK